MEKKFAMYLLFEDIKKWLYTFKMKRKQTNTSWNSKCGGVYLQALKRKAARLRTCWVTQWKHFSKKSNNQKKKPLKETVIRIAIIHPGNAGLRGKEMSCKGLEESVCNKVKGNLYIKAVWCTLLSDYSALGLGILFNVQV